jgi:hypothetical protein
MKRMVLHGAPRFLAMRAGLYHREKKECDVTKNGKNIYRRKWSIT